MASYGSPDQPKRDGVVYQTLFPSSIYWVHLPNAPQGRHWFAYDQKLRLVGAPKAPTKTFFGYAVPRQPDVGTPLTQNGRGERWKVDFEGKYPHISSRDSFIEVKPRIE